MTHSQLWISGTRLVAARRAAAAAATAAAAGVAALVAAAPAHAVLTVYTDAAAWAAALPQVPVSINFDDLADLTPLAGQYPGVSFSAFSGGNPLAAAYSFTQSGLNVVSLGDPPLRGAGGVAMDFTQQQRGMAFWYLDSEFAGNAVKVYGTANQLLGSFELVYPNPIPIAWRFVGFIDSGSDIRRVTVASAPNDMIALDSLQMAPVPEPASVALMLGGLVAVCAVRRRAGGPMPSSHTADDACSATRAI